MEFRERALALIEGAPGIGPGLVMPRYDGRSIANVSPTILRHFGVETPHASLAPDLLPPALLEGVRRIVVLIVDAFGYLQLLDALERQPDLALGRLLTGRDGRPFAFAPITSVFPSTTTAALPTLHTATPPAEHGGFGYTLFIPEFGAVTELIVFGPLAGRRPYPEGLIDPTTFLQAPPIWRRLGEVGVAGVMVNFAGFTGSALTHMLAEGAEFVPYLGLSDLLVHLRHRLERPTPERQVIFAYYGGLDTVAHRYGVDVPEHAAEVAAIDFLLQRELLSRLRRPETLLLLLADHGQIDTPPERGVNMVDHPRLLEGVAAVAGEARVRYLHLRPGYEAAVRAYLAEAFGDSVTVLTREAAFAAGLFGPAGRPLLPRVAARVGDLILLPAENRYLQHNLPETKPAPKMLGRHGSLTPGEMLVPLLATRLG